MPSSEPILFFSRGRGRGHAIPDLVIREELERLRPGLAIEFVSYATGAETLAAAGVPVVNLDLPDDAPFLELLVRASRVIAERRPALVVSHEEFAALPAAATYRCPALLLVDFFPSHVLKNESLSYAERILFIERRGIFPEPTQTRGKLIYTGPVVRPLVVTRADRAACRRELGLSLETKVVSVIPGAWATEARAPIAELVLPAFDALPTADKRLLWVAGRDTDLLKARVGARADVQVLPHHPVIERLMVASDVVLTKANRGTTIDLARLGVPSVSLSHSANAIDEAIIPRIQSNLALAARGIDGPFLGQILNAIVSAEGGGFEPAAEFPDTGALVAARELLRFFTERGALRPNETMRVSTD